MLLVLEDKQKKELDDLFYKHDIRDQHFEKMKFKPGFFKWLYWSPGVQSRYYRLVRNILRGFRF